MNTKEKLKKEIFHSPSNQGGSKTEDNKYNSEKNDVYPSSDPDYHSPTEQESVDKGGERQSPKKLTEPAPEDIKEKKENWRTKENE